MWFNILKERPKSINFMVKDEIWNQAYPLIEGEKAQGVVSVLELEEALGRKLTNEDFSHWPANWLSFTDDPDSRWERNPEETSILENRIGGIEGAKKLMRNYLELAGEDKNERAYGKRARLVLGEE